MKAVNPDKLFFRIGEVAGITALRPSVLRYWETEFKELRPKKSRTGQRLYDREDLQLVNELKQMLYVEKLTLEGARKRIAGKAKATASVTERVNLQTILTEIIADLRQLRDTL